MTQDSPLFDYVDSEPMFTSPGIIEVLTQGGYSAEDYALFADAYLPVAAERNKHRVNGRGEAYAQQLALRDLGLLTVAVDVAEVGERIFNMARGICAAEAIALAYAVPEDERGDATRMFFDYCTQQGVEPKDLFETLYWPGKHQNGTF